MFKNDAMIRKQLQRVILFYSQGKKNHKIYKSHMMTINGITVFVLEIHVHSFMHLPNLKHSTYAVALVIQRIMMPPVLKA